jgi:hypothetical protein
MAYVIYSKRNGAIKRITHELGTVLPSEGVIDCDDDVAHWSRRAIQPTYHDMNTLGIALFDDGSGVATTDPIDDSGGSREPMIAQEAGIESVLLPIAAAPQLWNKNNFLSAKYETVLSRNAPYHVVIGEEFIDDDHIDDANSDNYVLTNGSCVLAPGGYMQTTAFSFQERVYSTWAGFRFNKIWFQITPEETFGLQTEYDVSRDNSTWDAWIDLPRHKHHLMADDSGGGRGVTVTTPFNFIRFKITNQTAVALTVENFMVLLRKE